MKHTQSAYFATGILVLLVGSFGSTTSAKVEEDTMNFEVFVGSYSPGPDELDSEPTYGIRYGFDFTEKMGLQFELSQTGADDDFTSGMVTGSFDLDVTFLDVSFVRYFKTDGRISPTVYGGIGGAFHSLDLIVSGPLVAGSFQNIEDDTLTAHIGFGARIQLGESRAYLRPAGRIRWFEQREDDEIDTYFSLAIGWIIGG